MEDKILAHTQTFGEQETSGVVAVCTYTDLWRTRDLRGCGSVHKHRPLENKQPQGLWQCACMGEGECTRACATELPDPDPDPDPDPQAALFDKGLNSFGLEGSSGCHFFLACFTLATSH